MDRKKTDVDLERAVGRSESIAPLAELSELPREQRFPHLLADGTRARTMTQVAVWCAAQSGRSLRNIWHNYALYRRGGEQALLHRARRDKGSSWFFSAHHQAAVFAAYLHLTWRQSPRAIRTALLRDGALLGLEKLPSEATLRRWLKSRTLSRVALALEGQKIHRERMARYAKHGLLIENRRTA